MRLILLFVFMSGAAPVLAETPSSPAPFHEWQILETKTGQPIAFDRWIDEVAAADVVYLGEEHHNQSHIEAALKVLRALIEQGRQPALALEMFAWDSQSALDRHMTVQDFSVDAFVKDSHWEENWGGPFSDYAPLLMFARQWHIAVLALNPPRTLVRQVAKQGLAKTLLDPAMARWNMQTEQFVDDPAYRDTIIAPLRWCHGGMSDDGYQRMYEASLFRDEGMARTIAAALTQDPARRPIVSYTGGGHIQYRVPVPNRVQRRNGSLKQVTVYLAAYAPQLADEIQEIMKGGIADYVWLTPLSAQGLPRRCK